MKTSKRIIGFLIALLVVTLSVFAGEGAKTEAAGDLKQTAATAKTASISWTAPTKSSTMASFTITGYKIGIGGSYESADKNAQSANARTAGNVTSYTIGNLGTGKKYYVAVYCIYNYTSTSGYVYTNKSTFIGYTTVRTSPAKVVGLDQAGGYTTKSKSGLHFDWNQQKNVDGFQYVVYNGSKKVATNTTSYLSAEATYQGTDAGVTYKVVVRAYNTINGKKVYGPWSDPLYIVPQAAVTGISINSSKKTMKLSWEKVYGAKQYDIYISTTGRRTGYKKVATIKDANKLATNIKSVGGQTFDKQKTYYVYIKATKTIGGKNYSSKFVTCWYN